MKKEDILDKSRKESNDEGKQYAENKGRRIGVAAMCIIFIIVTIYNLLEGLNNYAVFALFWTYFGFESYGKYRFTKGKSELVTAVAAIVSGVVFLIVYIMTTLG